MSTSNQRQRPNEEVEEEEDKKDEEDKDEDEKDDDEDEENKQDDESVEQPTSSFSSSSSLSSSSSSSGGGGGRTGEERCGGDGRCLTHADMICTHECIPIDCVNVEVCGRIAPAWQFRARGGLCSICYDMFGRLLNIERNSAREDCPVCYSTPERWVEFPADCGHFFCGGCIARLLLFDETRFYLSPIPYGGPPCPMGCVNPRQGPQCNCILYDQLLNDWRETDPADWVRWVNAESDAIEAAEEWSEDMRKCPMCRERP